MKNRLLAALLCLCLLLITLPYAALAEEEPAPEPVLPTGTVYNLDAGQLNVREGPSTSHKKVGALNAGDVVTILSESEPDTAGYIWYQIRSADGLEGWCRSDYIRIDVTYEPNEEFEAYLTEQGFPEDYKPALRELYARYPNWVFQAAVLLMTFAEAVTAESEVLKNSLNSHEYPESWLSMEYGAYNWETGKYVEMDSGGWVTPTTEIIAYFMDPRNFLTDAYLFQFEDQLYSDKHTVEGVKAILPTKYDDYAEDLLKAALDANVSAYFLATRMAQEGTKIDGTWVDPNGVSYEGYYNFFNYGAYAGSQYGQYHGAVTNGAIFAQRAGWDSPYKCLLGSAQKIGANYIHKKQNTTYYQKFNVAGDNLYNHQYMSNINAPAAESTIRFNRTTAAELQNAITFIIPVYKEMPAVPAVKPSEDGNNNNFLDSLSVEGITIAPTFNRYTMEYAAQVTKETTAVTITATANNAEAIVAGVGTIQLYAGENLLPVTVTATSGAVRTYVISVFCEADVPEKPDEPPVEPPPPPVTPTPTITGTTYRVGDTITGVEPGTAVADFITALAVQDGAAKVYAADGTTEKAEGVLATGDILQVSDNDGKICVTLPVLLYGDVNGDGKVSTIDLRMIQKHILETAAIEGLPLTAADVNGDGKVSTIDLRMIQKHILGLLDSLQNEKGGAAQ